MKQRIDWDRMYQHLGRTLANVEEDVKAEGIDKLVLLSLGRKPPRIYATFMLPERLSELKEEPDLGTDSEQRALLSDVVKKTIKVDEIIKRYGLRRYAISPYFKGAGTLTRGYGYEHSQYKIPAKK